MNLFINDIPITLYDGAKEEFKKCWYDHVIDTAHHGAVTFEPNQKIRIRNPSMEYIERMLRDADDQSMAHPDSIDIAAQDYQGTKKYIEQQFKVVHAGGGIVAKKDKILLIYRFQKWDLPKGKKELGETSVQTAQREIEEECNITVTPLEKICTTWHSYKADNDKILKKTHWYTLRLLDDSQIQPRREEGIEDIQWVTQPAAEKMLKNSYKSILFVFNKYREQTEKKGS